MNTFDFVPLTLDEVAYKATKEDLMEHIKPGISDVFCEPCGTSIYPELPELPNHTFYIMYDRVVCDKCATTILNELNDRRKLMYCMMPEASAMITVKFMDAHKDFLERLEEEGWFDEFPQYSGVPIRSSILF